MTKLFAPVLIVALGVAGCASQVPVPRTYELTYQQKMQAAHHWNVLADHVAQRIHESMDPTGSGRLPLLHVVTPVDAGVFQQAYDTLLTTRLLEQGFNVGHRDGDGLRVVSEVQLVSHDDRGYIREHPAMWTTLGAGVAVADHLIDTGSGGVAAAGALIGWDVWNGHITGPTPDSEIIVTTSVMDGERYRARFSNIYYVSDPNWEQYVSTVPVAEPVYTRRMEMVDQ